MTPKEESIIVTACKDHEKNHGGDDNYHPCVFIDPYFVKYGNSETLDSHIKTQLQFSRAEQAGKPRIPKLIHHFQDEEDTKYVVMEYIKLVDPPSDLDDRMVKAAEWLAEVPAPNDHVFGPLGDGYIRHPFFEDDEAPLRFESVGALQRFIEKGRKRLYNQGKGVARVALKGERLIFMQPKMDASNFGVDEQGQTVLLGFGRIAYLPVSFATYTLSSDNKFDAFLKTLGSSGDSNLDSMVKISANLGMTGDPTLGLDENGKAR